MMIHNLNNIPEKTILEVLKALNSELSNSRNNDYNLLTLFYLGHAKSIDISN